MAKTAQNGLMSQTQFAKAIGVSQPMVAKYIREGHLEGCYERKGRRTHIDHDKAIKALPGRLDPSRHGKVKAGQGAAVDGDNLEEKLAAFAAGNIDFKNITYADANTIDKLYAALQKKQKYDTAEGLLIERAEMERIGGEVGELIKTTLLGIGPVHAPPLAAMDEPGDVADYLDEQMRNLVDDVLNLLSKI